MKLLKLVPDDTNIKFLKWRVPFFVVSIALIAASWALVMTKGLNFGVDFAGGLEVRATFTQSEEAPVAQLRSDIEGGWLEEGYLDVDPLFAGPGYWDPNGTAEILSDDIWVDGDYHLKSREGRWDPWSPVTFADRRARNWTIPQDGNTLVLTIDRTIQYLVEQEQKFMLRRIRNLRPVLEKSCYDDLYSRYVSERYRHAMEKRMAREDAEEGLSLDDFEPHDPEPTT